MLNVFLDLDGTLLDPKEGITASIQYALTELGADVPTADDLEWCIGPPLEGSFEVMLGAGADIDEALSLYRTHYIETEAMFDAEIYDGVGEMFDAFHRFDARMFIATSKPHAYAQTIIEHFGIHAHIERLFGSELDGTRGDKTELLQFALDETGVDPGQSVMIGDRKFDVFAGKNNDVASIGALWGYGEPDELRMAEPDMLAGHATEIPEISFDLLGLEVD